MRACGRDWSVCAGAAMAKMAAEAQITERSRGRDDVLMRFVIELEGPGWRRGARPLVMAGEVRVGSCSLVSISDRRLFGGVRLHGAVPIWENGIDTGRDAAWGESMPTERFGENCAAKWIWRHPS
jgi:hypothetical protein